jgi:hypothetical protein
MGTHVGIIFAGCIYSKWAASSCSSGSAAKPGADLIAKEYCKDKAMQAILNYLACCTGKTAAFRPETPGRIENATSTDARTC